MFLTRPWYNFPAASPALMDSPTAQDYLDLLDLTWAQLMEAKNYEHALLMAQLRLKLLLDARGEENDEVLQAIHALALTFELGRNDFYCKNAYRCCIYLAERLHGRYSVQVQQFCFTLVEKLCDPFEASEAKKLRLRGESIDV
jgi:hypothetical protein